MTYDAGFYDRIRKGCRDSAAALVPILFEQLNLPERGRVLDVGCGEGWFGAGFLDWGWEATGLEAGEVIDPQIAIVQHDLRDPTGFNFGVHDVALCLEVAEHIPLTHAQGLIKLLARSADLVVFSAAIPGQGGHDHINCQWPDFWADLFRFQGFDTSGELRWRIWDDSRIKSWYRQNLLVATRHPEALPHLFDTYSAKPLGVVHPDIWSNR